MSQWHYYQQPQAQAPASPTPRYAYLPQNPRFPQDPRPLPPPRPRSVVTVRQLSSSPPKPFPTSSFPSPSHHHRPLPTPNLPRPIKSHSLDIRNMPYPINAYPPPMEYRVLEPIFNPVVLPPAPTTQSFVPYWKRNLPGPTSQITSADMSRRNTVSGPVYTTPSFRRPLPASPAVAPTVPSSVQYDKDEDRPPSPQYGILDLPKSRSVVEQPRTSVVNGARGQPTPRAPSTTQSIAYQMASMSLDNNKPVPPTWHSTLPPLPRVPGKNETIDLDDAPPPSLRRSPAPSQPSVPTSRTHAARTPQSVPLPSQSRQAPAPSLPSVPTARTHAVRPPQSVPPSPSQSRQSTAPLPSVPTFSTHAARTPQSVPHSSSQSRQVLLPSVPAFRAQAAGASRSASLRRVPASSQTFVPTSHTHAAGPPQSTSASSFQSRQSSVPAQSSVPTFRALAATHQPQTSSVSTNHSHDPIPQRTAIPKISFPAEVDSDSDDDGPTISVSLTDNDGPQISIPSISVGNDPPTSRPRSIASLPTVRRTGGLSCGGCGGAIIGRIVSAMGVRWHPGCFKCCICHELLENLSSYEKDGKPYCHLDYHEAYAPKCYHCNTTIVDEQFITLDDHELGRRTYHEQHFFCAECGDPFLSLSSGNRSFTGDGAFKDDDVGFTVYKGHPYCESCHVRLRMPKCKKCKKSIRDGMKAVEALGSKWCWECFVCAGCDQPFENPSFFQRDDYPFCERCFSIIIKNEL